MISHVICWTRPFVVVVSFRCKFRPFQQWTPNAKGGSETSVDDTKNLQFHPWLLIYQYLHFRQFPMKLKTTPETFGRTRSVFPPPPPCK